MQQLISCVCPFCSIRFLRVLDVRQHLSLCSQYLSFMETANLSETPAEIATHSRHVFQLIIYTNFFQPRYPVPQWNTHILRFIDVNHNVKNFADSYEIALDHPLVVKYSVHLCDIFVQNYSSCSWVLIS